MSSGSGKGGKESVIQVRSKDLQVKTQLVLWIFILFKVVRLQHVSASITLSY